MNGAGRSHQPIIICKLTDQWKGQSKMRVILEVYEQDVKEIEKYMDKNDITYWQLFEAIALMIENDELKVWL